ncbi:hypothetical protein BD769DRAFT_1672139 [Suillus cothurnatus]|nr:hypothetical protein BD769DRAFT_1672139 [Suillus cothurnatus]
MFLTSGHHNLLQWQNLPVPTSAPEAPNFRPQRAMHVLLCLGGCHLTDHAGSGVLLDAEGLELEDGPEDTGDTHAVLPDNNDNEPIIPIPAETPPCLPSPQPHAPPTVEASTMDMPDNSRIAHPRVPRAHTVPAHNCVSQENGPHYCMQMPEVFMEQLAETLKRDEVQRQRRADEIEAQNRARYHIVVYAWVKDGSQPNVFEFQSGTSMFHWPHLSLSDEVLSIMGLAATNVIHIWNHSRCEWQGVQPGYLIIVVEGQPILLKNTSVTDCIDLDSCIWCANDSPPNIRTHLAAECAAVHLDLRKHNNTLPNADEVVFRPHVKLRTSSSELEVEALLSSEGKGKDPANRSPSPVNNHALQAKPSPSYSAYSIPSFGTPSPPSKPKRLVCRHSPSLSMPSPPPKPKRPASRCQSPHSPTTSVGSSPPRTRQKPLHWATARPSAGSSTAHARLSLGTLSDPIDIDNVKVWPGDFYACDIAKGFALCGAVGKRHQGVSAVFQKMFGVPYVSTTFHVHRKRWEDAPATVTDKFIKAGRTEAGLWTKFMAGTRS